MDARYRGYTRASPGESWASVLSVSNLYVAWRNIGKVGAHYLRRQYYCNFRSSAPNVSANYWRLWSDVCRGNCHTTLNFTHYSQQIYSTIRLLHHLSYIHTVVANNIEPQPQYSGWIWRWRSQAIHNHHQWTLTIPPDQLLLPKKFTGVLHNSP